MLAISEHLRSCRSLDSVITLPLKVQDRSVLQMAIYIKSIAMR